MKENAFKAVLAVAVGGLTSYFNEMAIPLFILIAVMCIDYISGLCKAWINADLSSKTGIKGIVKKVSYLLVVCVAAVVDWLILSGFHKIGISIEMNYFFGAIVAIWLIINECISILENLAVIGVPLPPFLTRTVHKLKIAVESKSGNDKEDN